MTGDTLIQQDNPYFGIHYTGAASNRYSATFGAAAGKFVIGYYDSLAEAIQGRKAAIAQKREEHGN